MYNGLKKPLWSHRYVCFLGPIRNSARLFFIFSHRVIFLIVNAQMRMICRVLTKFRKGNLSKALPTKFFPGKNLTDLTKI